MTMWRYWNHVVPRKGGQTGLRETFIQKDEIEVVVEATPGDTNTPSGSTQDPTLVPIWKTTKSPLWDNCTHQLTTFMIIYLTTFLALFNCLQIDKLISSNDCRDHTPTGKGSKNLQYSLAINYRQPQLTQTAATVFQNTIYVNCLSFPDDWHKLKKKTNMQKKENLTV